MASHLARHERLIAGDRRSLSRPLPAWRSGSGRPAWLLLDSTPPPRVVRAAERPRLPTPSGTEATEVDGGTSRDLRILEVVVPAGASTGVHAHSGDEHHVVLAGRWRMSQGDHVSELGPGDYLAWDPTVPHDVENIGDEPGRVLIIYPRHSGRGTDPSRS